MGNSFWLLFARLTDSGVDLISQFVSVVHFGWNQSLIYLFNVTDGLTQAVFPVSKPIETVRSNVLIIQSVVILTVFNRIRHVLDRKTRIAYFNGLVLPHFDYADIIWGDQPGLKAEMEQLQAFQNRFEKKIELKKKLSSVEVAKLDAVVIKAILLNWSRMQ